MAFDGTFSSQRGDCDVWIEDDDRVGYAYVLDAEGKIRGDVWLYNRGPAPQDFEETDKTAAPLNPAPYVDSAAPFTPPNSMDDFSVHWIREGGALFARVFIRDKLAAILANGTQPGWSALAKDNGPVANVLPTDDAQGPRAQ
jgi:hypothetical protein